MRHGVYPLESRFNMDQVVLLQVRSILLNKSIILNTNINKESFMSLQYFFPLFTEISVYIHQVFSQIAALLWIKVF